MPRFFVNPGDWGRDEVVLGREASHHLLGVLRAGVGDAVAVFDGRGREASGELCRVVRGDAVVRVRRRWEEQRPPVRLALWQSVLKGPNMDLVVQKATELGVSTIVPVIAERGVVRLEDRRAEERRGKWERIAIGALEQCGSNWLPEIAPVAGFPEAIRRAADSGPMILGSLQGNARPLKAVLGNLAASRPASLGVWIGPEGDFTAAESEAIVAAGAIPASFGRRVLRAETAALYALSVMASEFLAAEGA